MTKIGNFERISSRRAGVAARLIADRSEMAFMYTWLARGPSRDISVKTAADGWAEHLEQQDANPARVRQGAHAAGQTDNLARSLHDLAGQIHRQAGRSDVLKRSCHSDLPDDEGAVGHRATTSHQFRAEPTATDRTGLGGSGFQYFARLTDNPYREPSFSRISGAVVPVDRQHRHQGRRGTRIDRP
jgi:hypothetical protein